MNIDRRKQMQDKLRHRRERRSGNRQAATEAAAIEEGLKPTAVPPSATTLLHPTSAPMVSLAEAFDATLQQPTVPPSIKRHQTAQATDNPSQAKGIRPTLAVYAKLSLHELREKAATGDAAALYTLAEQYRANGYEEESYLPYLQAAADAAFLPAEGLYGAHLWQQGKREQGGGLVEKAAKFGFGDGAFLLFRYAEQHGQAAEARKWLEMAGKTPCPAAFRALAYCYRTGTFVPRDTYLAGEWMKRAADAGDAEAALLYARYIFEYKWRHGKKYPFKESMRYFRKAVEEGNDDALFELAELYRRLYRQGDKYITKEEYLKICYRGPDDYSYLGWSDQERQATALYIRAAAKSEALRCRVIGILRSCSQAIRRDVLYALAEQGDAEALFLLGKSWENEYSHYSKSYVRERAIHYYRRAAEAGHGPASSALQRLDGYDA